MRRRITYHVRVSPQVLDYLIATPREWRALLSAARAILKIDPFHALGVFPVYSRRHEDGTMHVLVFPEKRGWISYLIEEEDAEWYVFIEDIQMRR